MPFLTSLRPVALAGFTAALCLGLAACGPTAPLNGLGGSTGSSPLDPRAVAKACSDSHAAEVERRLSLLPADQVGEYVVAFHGEGPLTAAQRELLTGLGISGLYLSRAPIAGILATRTQVEALKRHPMVRSVIFNDPVAFDDDVARNLTSVDVQRTRPELRNANGEPLTGKGITILVNDSGIDGTHPDLPFGSKVVENVMAATSLRLLANAVVDFPVMLPHTPAEGVPNSDLLGSHGTHVASIAAGTGAASNGKFAGVAPGASLIGYGSGAALLILDTLGGFDYALKILDERPELNLRIVTNSFGSPGDVGTCFNPDHPTNILTKKLADRGVIVVFSAGNSGSGPDTITGNFKKAPWILIAANGQKSGLLAPSSSRGSLTNPEYEVEVDGEILLVEDRPTVVTPGTNYIAARAMAADPFLPLDLSDDLLDEDYSGAEAVFYTKKTGTSMAAPHLAGLVALVLEANPALTWREVKDIFKRTATNVVGYAPFEVGAGFANAEAAVAMALQLRDDYGGTVHLLRRFNSVVGLGEATQQNFELDFVPVGPADSATAQFEVPEGVALVLAQWSQPLGNLCTCGISLIDPLGNRYGSSIALPLLGANVAASAPGMPGIWTVRVRGIGGVAGVTLDPLGLTNGVAGPDTVNVRVSLFEQAEPLGLDDVKGHPSQAAIEFAVSRRLVDGIDGKVFMPDAPLTRVQLADYLMAWGVRQNLPHDGSHRFADVSGLAAALADAMSGRGQLLFDRNHEAGPLMPWLGSAFEPEAPVTVEQAAFTLVQALGREAATARYAEVEMFGYDENDNVVKAADEAAVDPRLRNHVQDAIVLGILKPVIVMQDGEPRARINPKAVLSRAEFAEMAVRTLATVDFP